MNNDKITIGFYERKSGERLSSVERDMANEKLIGLALTTAAKLHLEENEALRFVGIEQSNYILARVWLYRGSNRFRFSREIMIRPAATVVVAGSEMYQSKNIALEIMLFFRAP
jgi:hypothetical protein